MVLTIPLGPRERLSIGHVGGCGGGWWTMRWRRRRLPAWDDGGDPPPDGGVREPRVPRLPTLDGAVALDPDGR